MPSIFFPVASPLVALAPMAGISDWPFRRLCLSLGCNATWGEMLTDDQSVWQSGKSLSRQVVADDPHKVVQLLGVRASSLLDAALALQDRGARQIDLNFGCPAKKVSKKAAGAALMAQPDTMVHIVRTLAQALNIPVSVKMRTGVNRMQKNAVTLARQLQDAGACGLTIHGRTKADLFAGDAEYDTIAEVVQQTQFPVIANGDITSADKAMAVLAHTQAAGIMVGRSAQGNPWIFQQIQQRISGKKITLPNQNRIWQTWLRHWQHIHAYYEETHAVRMARKHFRFLVQAQALPISTRPFMQASSTEQQYQVLMQWADTFFGCTQWQGIHHEQNQTAH